MLLVAITTRVFCFFEFVFTGNEAPAVPSADYRQTVGGTRRGGFLVRLTSFAHHQSNHPEQETSATRSASKDT